MPVVFPVAHGPGGAWPVAGDSTLFLEDSRSTYETESDVLIFCRFS